MVVSLSALWWKSKFLLKGEAVFPLGFLTWGQTMVEVMKIMATSFKRCHAGPATVSALTVQQATTNPRLQQRFLHTHRQVWVSLLWVTAPFFWALVCTRFCCALRESDSPVLWTFWQLCSGLMVNFSKRAYAIPRSTAPRVPVPAAVHCWPVSPQDTPKHSSVSVSVWL